MLLLVFSAIVVSACEGDGRREARAGRVLHLSRGVLPGVLNIKSGGCGARAAADRLC